MDATALLRYFMSVPYAVTSLSLRLSSIGQFVASLLLLLDGGYFATDEFGGGHRKGRG